MLFKNNPCSKCCCCFQDGDYVDQPIPGVGDLALTSHNSLRLTNSSISVPMSNGNVMTLALNTEADIDPCVVRGRRASTINITDEVNRSGIWMSMQGSKENKQDM